VKRIRVLVVEDSLTVRKRLCEVLAADPQLEVVAEAEDGQQAIELCGALRPDVITLDMMLPRITGVGVTEHVMAHFPTPILIVSSSTNRGELFRTYDALAAGAVDVLDKPSADGSDEAWERQLLSTIKLISRIKVITHLRGKLTSAAPLLPPALPEPPGRPVRVVALGASTGGPGAVREVLRALPLGFPIPILVVIHLGLSFARSLGEWLDGQSPHRVSYARHGQALAELAGRVILAPADQHLEVRQGKLLIHNGPERHSCRPSVDILFESLAQDLGRGCGAALLTGMGKDGAAGLLAIRRAGGATLAQDAATSVVYGMPREAVQLGAAERELPLQQIGPALAAMAAGAGRSHP